jgi:tRNA/rRNA methyltransferase
MAGEAPFETGEPRVLAQRAGVLSFFDFLDASLAEVGYFRPEEKRPIMMRNLQNILHRMEMSEQDLRSLRGAFEALYHGGRNKKQNATGAADRAQPNNV